MKTLQANSDIGRQRRLHQEQMQTVCRLLNWSEDQYCNHQFEVYTDFLKRMFYGWPVHFLTEAMYSPVMRGFFNNEWEMRNAFDFIPWAVDLTEDHCQVTAEGKLHIEPGMPFGDAYLIEEYLNAHNMLMLIDDPDFMKNYCQILKMI